MPEASTALTTLRCSGRPGHVIRRTENRIAAKPEADYGVPTSNFNYFGMCLLEEFRCRKRHSALNVTSTQALKALLPQNVPSRAKYPLKTYTLSLMKSRRPKNWILEAFYKKPCLGKAHRK